MRRWTDPEGREWDVVIGRESWGALCALFVPRSASAEVAARQAALHAADHVAAETELARMDEHEIATLFQASSEKET